MGIPGFFNFIKKYNTQNQQQQQQQQQQQHIITNKLPNSTKQQQQQEQHLFLDFNCSIYSVLNKDKTHAITTIDSFIINILGYLDILCMLHTDLKTLYIAIDGVPPRAKIEQQRARRFKNAKTLKNNEIDTNMITPGTPFMYELSQRIKKHLETSPLYSNILVIFNGADVPLEGEHKILEFLKFNSSILNQPENQIIIYGLDADLIMLSIVSHYNNIFLLREKTEYGQYALTFEGYEFLYLDIDLLKEYIIREFEIHLGDILIEEIPLFLDDYVFICFILGNDFISKIPWLDIKQGGYDTLIECYCKAYNMHYEHIFNSVNSKINHNMFYFLFEIFAAIEDDKMKELFQRRLNARPNMRNVKTEDERRTQLDLQKPLLDINLEKEIQMRYDLPATWRDRFYPMCFSHSNTLEDVNKIVFEYLASIVWTSKYYFKELPSWSWFYPFHYAPTVRDILNFLNHNNTVKSKNREIYNINDIAATFNKDKPVKPQELLLMVLPVESHYHLSASYRHLHTTPELKPYFPSKYEIRMLFHSYTWECHPIIPPIDYDIIKYITQNCKLTIEEQKRNKTGIVFILEPK